MATKLSGTSDKKTDLTDTGIDADDTDFEAEPEVVPPIVPAAQKHPMIRRKIEDRLERIRLREELGIYDDEQLNDF